MTDGKRRLAGRYRIDGLLGRGGMSEVYFGYDALDRDQKRFLREIRNPPRGLPPRRCTGRCFRSLSGPSWSRMPSCREVMKGEIRYGPSGSRCSAWQAATRSACLPMAKPPARGTAPGLPPR
jgi:serine/threonine protein kinase